MRCGQCLPCRVARRRLWSARIFLESLCFTDNSFVTLTYKDSPGTLDPKHSQLWLKRLRKSVHPLKIRFFLVGEYGDLTFRPHYHAILFGYPACEYGKPRVTKASNCPCSPCQTLQSSWSYGFTYLGTVTHDSAQYVSGYTVKKMTSKDDDRLEGRYPEFARMSNRPGIGATYLQHLVDTLNDSDFASDAFLDGDVPTNLTMGKKSLPLGSYLRSKLRVMLGMDPKTPVHILEAYADQCRDDVINSKSDYERIHYSVPLTYPERLASVVRQQNASDVLSFEKRYRIFESRKRKPL